jgi:hypothetical protein
MTGALWIDDTTIQQLADGKGIRIHAKPLPDHFIVPPLLDPETRWGSDLGLPPAELEEQIIRAFIEHPELFNVARHVDISFNPLNPFFGDDQRPLRYFIVGYQETPLDADDMLRGTNRLLDLSGLAPNFRPYGINFVSKPVAEKLEYPFDQITYHQTILTCERGKPHPLPIASDHGPRPEKVGRF